MRVAAMAVLVMSAGCSGGGGGAGAQSTENEPNDDISIATDLGGAGSHEIHGNTCSGEDSIDDYRVTASTAGTISLTLEWDETNPDDDLAARFLDVDGFPLGTQADTPPAVIETAVATMGEIVFIEVVCYGAFDPVPYAGTVVVP